MCAVSRERRELEDALANERHKQLVWRTQFAISVKEVDRIKRHLRALDEEEAGAVEAPSRERR